jgi:glycosyltransferase involved in cell wall biosynthesis
MAFAVTIESETRQAKVPRLPLEADLSVSVILPAYNAAPFVRRAINSAITQSGANFEIIVVDDGSTDATATIVRSIADPRVRLLSQANAGQGAARNRGIDNARGRYISFLDADDIYLAGKLQKQASFLHSHPEFDSVYCNAVHFFTGRSATLYKLRNTCPPDDTLAALLQTSLINPNTFMCRSEALRAAGGFREGVYGRYSEEWELYLRLACAGHRFGHIDEGLVAVEVRRDSNTTWDVQWVIKKNSLEMLDSVFAQMDRARGHRYGRETVLRRQRAKLLVAHLIAGHRQEALELLGQLALAGWQRWPLETAIRIVPAGLMRESLIRAWRLVQRRNWELVRSKAVHSQVAAAVEQQQRTQ